MIVRVISRSLAASFLSTRTATIDARSEPLFRMPAAATSARHGKKAEGRMSGYGTNAKCGRVCDVAVLRVKADSQQTTVENFELAGCALVDCATVVLTVTINSIQ